MYCRMLQGEHSAILSTSIKLPFVIEIFVLSIFEWPFYIGLTVLSAHAFFVKSAYAVDVRSFHFLDKYFGRICLKHVQMYF